MSRFLNPAPFWQNTGLLLIRVCTGLFMAFHGWEIFDSAKMSEYMQWDSFNTFLNPSTLVYGGKAAELIGGILLILGLFTRIGSLLIAGSMAYISFLVADGKVFTQDQHPFLFVLLAAVFFFTGPGKWSLDYILFKKKK